MKKENKEEVLVRVAHHHWYETEEKRGYQFKRNRRGVGF